MKTTELRQIIKKQLTGNLYKSGYLYNYKGVTLIEIVIAMGVMALLGLGIATFYSGFSKTISRTSHVVDATIEFATGSAYLFSDLKRADPSLNVVHLDDEAGNNFFDYTAIASLATDGPETRKIVLALKGPDGQPRAIKYASALQEISFLISSKHFSSPLPISPLAAYKDGINCSADKCTAATPMNRTGACGIGDACLKLILDRKEQENFGAIAQSQNTSPLYFFVLPAYFSRDANCPAGPPMLYFHLAKMNGSGVLESMMTAVNANLHAEMFQPTTCGAINSLDAFFKYIPVTVGPGANVLVQKVEWIKYKLEQTKIKGRDTTRLLRIVMDYAPDGSVTEGAPFLVAEGFDAIELTRASIKLPIISFKFIKQFYLNKDKSETETL